MSPLPPLFVALAVALAGCDNMKDQPALRASDLPRLAPSGAVARGEPPVDDPVNTGFRGGEPLGRSPVAFTQERLARGRERFTIYCAPCHGEDGYGMGIVVRRGFPPPPSLHEERLRTAPDGHLFDVMTRGYGAMLPYADRLPPEDRWAIVAYIRALERSQHATLADVPAAQRGGLSP
jgi:mono/diheme cytochrome c family protein